MNLTEPNPSGLPINITSSSIIGPSFDVRAALAAPLTVPPVTMSPVWPPQMLQPAVPQQPQPQTIADIISSLVNALTQSKTAISASSMPSSSVAAAPTAVTVTSSPPVPSAAAPAPPSTVVINPPQPAAPPPPVVYTVYPPPQPAPYSKCTVSISQMYTVRWKWILKILPCRARYVGYHIFSVCFNSKLQFLFFVIISFIRFDASNLNELQYNFMNLFS